LVAEVEVLHRKAEQIALLAVEVLVENFSQQFIWLLAPMRLLSALAVQAEPHPLTETGVRSVALHALPINFPLLVVGQVDAHFLLALQLILLVVVVVVEQVTLDTPTVMLAHTVQSHTVILVATEPTTPQAVAVAELVQQEQTTHPQLVEQVAQGQM